MNRESIPFFMSFSLFFRFGGHGKIDFMINNGGSGFFWARYLMQKH
ncbi:hypothetical protein BAME_31850 [Bacillus sp. M 2-6]|nr:hypothetical protein BAME_31850 [Bacillus sp. M 2-6]